MSSAKDVFVFPKAVPLKISSILINKLLIISGPTATGKTALAIKLSRKFNGEIISADSRQIYRGMDIGTGKDHPKDIKIHLIDLITPDKSFSVAQYRQLALEKISEIQAKNKLPILVGGTGQYIDSIINPQPTFSIKPNKILRFFLNKLPTERLQSIYKLLDNKKYSSLNNSDQNNPHRLIRKIEIKLSPQKKSSFTKNNFDIFHLSLTAPNSYLYPQINKRIKKRLDSGLIDEIKYLLKSYRWSDPGLNSLAYKEFQDYFSKNLTLIEVVKKWQGDEHAYARRQKTWFKKNTPDIFINITLSAFSQKALNLVKKWYNLL
jgi:tRNA dimethylallyltransferase